MMKAVIRPRLSIAVISTLAIVLVSLVSGYVVAVSIDLAIMGIFSLMVVLAALFLMSIDLYRQLCVFLALLLVFTFASKIGYGIVNSTLLALLPTAFLGFMVVQLLRFRKEGKQHRFHWTPLDIFVITFIGLNLLQILNPHLDIYSDQQFLEVGLRGFWQRSFMGLSYFLARVLVRSKYKLNTVIKILAYSITLSSFYALLQQLFGFDLLESHYRQIITAGDLLAVNLYAIRSTGFLGSPFTFGMVSAMGVWCSIYLLLLRSITKSGRFLLAISLVINLLAVLLSGSRSTYLALLFSVAIVFMLRWQWWITLVLRRRGLLLSTLLTLAVIRTYFSDNYNFEFALDRVRTVTQLSTLFSGDQLLDRNFVERQQLANASLSLILENPLGYGAGIFTGGANPEGIVRIQGYSTWIDNEFSALALELGVLGVGLLLMMIAMALRRCWIEVRQGELSNQAIILAALVIICPVAGIGGQWMTAYPANILFWLILGTIGNLPAIARSATEQVKRHRLSPMISTGGTTYDRSTI